MKRKLNYRFHNPNSPAETADYIVKILIVANMGKAEAAIRAAAKRPPGEDGPPLSFEGHSA